MGQLTTHILDTANGTPADGVAIRLYAIETTRTQVAAAVTNRNGRTDEALLDGSSLRAGCYELEFDVGPYFSSRHGALDDPPFLNTIVIRVNLSASEHYHVPLLVSPWSYSTYRGS